MRLLSLRRALAAVALLATAGCSFAGDATAPTARPSAARVAMAAQLVGAAQSDPFSLRVTSGYVRATGEFVSLGTQTLALTDARTQQVPVTIDLATCLNDPARRGADQGAGADALCYVQLTVVLLTGERVLDTQVVGPLALRPGGTATPDRPLALYSVSTVRVAPAAGTAPPDGVPYRLEMGQTLALTAVVQDAGGQPVPDRPATWTSTPATVARVDAASGVVTPLAPGRARVTATAGGRDASVDVQVVPAPAAITITGAGTGAGRITSSPAGLDCRVAAGQATGACSVIFPGDAAVTLTAAPDVGSSFAAWGGDCAASAGALTCTVTPSVPRAVVATFTAFRALDVTLAGAGTGTVTSAPAGVTCARANGATTGACTAPFLDATSVTLTAAPDPASVFAGWTGACTGASTTCTVTLDQARAVTATFARRQIALTLALGGSGGGTVTVTAPAGGPGVVGAGTCPLTVGQGSTTCTVPVEVGAPLTLTPSPEPASFFAGWGGACAATAAGSPCTLTATADVSAAAAFTLRPVALSVSPASGNAGAGTVATADNAIACAIGGATTSGACQADIAVGASVTLTATPSAQQVFLGWGGDCAAAGTAAACTLTVRAAAAVTVRFGPPQSLAVTTSGTGGGRVAGGGVDCAYANGSSSGTCAASGTFGTAVTLTATADSASTFGGWGGACTGTGACTVTLDQARTVSATFTRRTVTVTYALSGAGDGSVAVNGTTVCTLAPGANSASCTREVPAFGPLSATALPGSSSQFTGWAGPCTGAGACTFAPGASVTLGAVFTPTPVAVTVSADPQSLGNGTVTSSPAGVSCAIVGTTQSGACGSPFAVGSTVTLTAAPAQGFAFAGWTGACASATGPTCALPVGRSALAAAVRFTPTSATLNVAAAAGSTGSGVVSVRNETIVCEIANGVASGDCAETFTGLPALVVLSASHGAFDAFDEWSGVTCAEGQTSGTCTVTLVTSVTARAAFRRLPTVVVTPSASGTGSGTLTVTSPVAFSCTLGVGGSAGACQFTVPVGAPVTLNVVPDVNTAGFTWGGACAGQASGGACTFTAAAGANPAVTYTPRTYAVSVARGTANTGAGTVTSSPAGVSCTIPVTGAATGSCASAFNAWGSVTLTAAPATGSTFAGWAGACEAAGSAPTCTLTNLQAAADVRANFSITMSPVAVVPASGNDGSGIVTGSGFNCTITGSQFSGACSTTVPFGTTVTLTATANRLNNFGGWPLDVTCAQGQNSPICTFVVTRQTTVHVPFVPQSSVQVTASPSGQGSASVHVTAPFDTTCTIVAGQSATACLFRVATNAAVTFRATEGPGTANISQDSTCTNRLAQTCSFTATRDTSVTLALAPTLTPESDVDYWMLHGSFRLWDGTVTVGDGIPQAVQSITVAPGTPLRFQGSWQIGPVTDVRDCPFCVIQIYSRWIANAPANGTAALRDSTDGGLWSGRTSRTDPSEGPQGTYEFTTTAPLKPGTYYFGGGTSLEFGFKLGYEGRAGYRHTRPAFSNGLAGRASVRVIVLPPS